MVMCQWEEVKIYLQTGMQQHTTKITIINTKYKIQKIQKKYHVPERRSENLSATIMQQHTTTTTKNNEKYKI